MYKVIKHFTDLMDDGYPYEVGDTYPRDGKQVSEKRIEELEGSHNRQKRPLIKAVEEEPVEEEPKKRGRKPKADTEKSE